MATKPFTLKEKFDAAISSEVHSSAPWKGTFAANHADAGSLSNYLRDANLLAKDEQLLGVKAWLDEEGFVVECFASPLMDDEAYDAFLAQETQMLRRFELDLTLEAFFNFFGKVEIALSSYSCLAGKTIEYKSDSE